MTTQKSGSWIVSTKTKGPKKASPVFAFIWTLSIAVADIAIGYRIVSNLWTHTYTETKGTITSADLEEKKGSKGSISYLPRVEYDYTLQEKTYHGKHRRQMESAVGGVGVKAKMEKIIAQYPVGKQVPVYYDSRHPETAVLETGLDGGDLFLLLALTPFNVVMLILWGVGAPKNFLSITGSYLDTIQETDSGWILFLTSNRTYSTFIFWFGGLSFAALFLVTITQSAMPSQTVMLIVWGIILIASKYLGKVWGGSPQRLEIHDMNRTVQLMDLPGSFPIESKEIQRIRVLPVHSSPDSKTGSQVTYQVGIEFTDDEEEGNARDCEVRFLNGATREQSVEVARWIAEKLGLPESKVVLENSVAS